MWDDHLDDVQYEVDEEGQAWTTCERYGHDPDDDGFCWMCGEDLDW
jgi:hypothetical protein